MAETDDGVPNREELPDALTDRPQWLCWRGETRDGKQTKVPVDPTTGQVASATDPETWTDFEQARETVCMDVATGVGFAFAATDPLVGVDLDDCRCPDSGELTPWARDIVDRLASYTEVSPSGTGIHVLVEGNRPAGPNRRGDVECYDANRYFTVTGTHLEGTPTDIRDRPAAIVDVCEEYILRETDGEGGSDDDGAGCGECAVTDGADRADSSGTATGDASVVPLPDAELLSRARSAANGEKFQRLWAGDISGYDSHSEADMALCALLAFWTGKDPHRVDRLFRRSGLVRPKWDEVHFADGSTYGEKTVERAVAGTDEAYTPPQTGSTWNTSTDAVASGSVPTPTNRANTDDRQPTATGGGPGASTSPPETAEALTGLVEKLREQQTTIDRLQADLEAERERCKRLADELAAAEASSRHTVLPSFLAERLGIR